MIISRRVNSEEELKASNLILKSYDILEKEDTDNSIKYVIIEDNKVKGVCKVVYDGSEGILNYVVIDKNETGQNLGEALIRATFNSCLSNGVKKIYFETKNDYLLKKGFKEKNNIYNKKSFSLEIDLEKFFASPCKH